MEELGREIIFPKINQIIDSNRQIINISGGFFSEPDNLQNKGSLEYIDHAIRYTVYGENLFPSLLSKAAALTYEIIQSHVFYDGNKRTGIHMAWEFLQANGTDLIISDSAEEIAISIAKGVTDREGLEEWIRMNI